MEECKQNDAIPMKAQFTDMSEFFDDQEYGDIRFKFSAPDNENEKESKDEQDSDENPTINCHLFLLNRRCRKLLDTVVEELNDKNEYQVNDFSYPVFKVFLSYLYSGRVDCGSFGVNELIDLYELTETYKEELDSLLERYLVEDIRQKCLVALKSKVAKLSLDELMVAYDRARAYDDLREEVSKPMSRHLNERTCVKIAMFADDNGLESLLKASARYIRLNGKKVLPQLKDNPKASNFCAKLLFIYLDEE